MERVLEMKKGFDTKKYLDIQEKEILERLSKFDRLYLEVGGHLVYDGHASRVLPGYNPKTKILLLNGLKKKLCGLEIIYCVSAKDLKSKKRLGDFKVGYSKQVLLDVSSLKKNNLPVRAVVVTMFKPAFSKEVESLKKVLDKKGVEVVIYRDILNYVKSPKFAVAGFKEKPYLSMKSKLVVITGAAGGSGKMAVSMCQTYLDLDRGLDSGYAKLETFPIWNLSLSNPLNLAYEAATADLQDKNQIDPYHLRHYHQNAINYNRDIANFSVLMQVANLIKHKKNAFGYYSPTDMGVSNTKEGIIDLKVCESAAKKEIYRRMNYYLSEFRHKRESKKTIERMNEIMGKLK